MRFYTRLTNLTRSYRILWYGPLEQPREWYESLSICYTRSKFWQSNCTLYICTLKGDKTFRYNSNRAKFTKKWFTQHQSINRNQFKQICKFFFKEMTAENGQNGEQMGNGKMVAFKFFSKDFCRILFSIVDIYQSIYAMKCLKSTDKKIKKIGMPTWYILV